MDQYTKLLLHMDEFSFKDECSHAIINNGVTLDTNIKKFGHASAYFNGTTSSLITSFLNTDDLMLANDDFEIDCWIYPISIKDWSTIFTTNNGYSIWYLNIGIAINSGKLIITSMGLNPQLQSNTTIQVNQWTHIVYSYSKISGYAIYINGIKDAINLTTTPPNNTFTSFIIGGRNGTTDSNSGAPNYGFNGYIDEFRISKGIARWTSNFTPQSYSYGNKYLIQDGDKIKTTTDGINLTDLGTTYDTTTFYTYGMDDLTKINSTVLSKIQNNQYKILMQKN